MVAALLALLALAPAAPASHLPATFPAAGEILWDRIAVRRSPNPRAKVVKVLPQFRSDYRLQIVHAKTAWIEPTTGKIWYKLSLPMRPNGRTGWVPEEGVELRPVKNEIVIDRSARRLRVHRGKKVLLDTRVAVGRAGMETPLGYFYVTAKFRPSAPILGAYAIETSAYSKLSEWPGGGVVGLHGTYQPELLGQAVSHGCVRMSNAAILRLKRLAPLGTPIRIVR